MKVIIFGATGMIGRGVLQECLLDAEVDDVLTVGRSVTGLQHEKLNEILHKDLLNLSAIEGDLAGYEACFFCLGVSSVGMKEQEYQRVTYDITRAVAQTLVKLNTEMTFIYVSGSGTDSTEQGRVMWARVKGKTENALLRLPFKAAYMFRPAFIQPCSGIVSRTKLYRVLYRVLGIFYPILKRLFPQYVTTTEILGRTMIKVAKQGAQTSIIESKDIRL
ncbi:NAD-dependent epimerase/dehydratase family protein [Desulfosporosinus sp. BG]|uniref:NAD-dependent epimerase/dehydratase family protein n=1 Tax=Desulfosporosinus sp. BG TaxID=1633135 RepID=UPI00083AB135|nr:NAD-dependent epimerase/dehydratase family protein [Desulfosporosinus sp. BG]ODA41623.1 Oxidoreductase [Desulfosporosinus sp. BG]